MQVTADIFNRPTSRPHTFETSGLGAAISGAVGLRLHRDFSTAVAEMTRLGATFEPNPSDAELYERLYIRVYKRMHRRLAPPLRRTSQNAPPSAVKPWTAVASGHRLNQRIRQPRVVEASHAAEASEGAS